MVCVFYTSVGGMKAVVWTDVFQLFFMFLSVLMMVFLATSQAGGPAAVLIKNYEAGRIQGGSRGPFEAGGVYDTKYEC